MRAVTVRMLRPAPVPRAAQASTQAAARNKGTALASSARLASGTPVRQRQAAICAPRVATWTSRGQPTSARIARPAGMQASWPARIAKLAPLASTLVEAVQSRAHSAPRVWLHRHRPVTPAHMPASRAQWVGTSRLPARHHAGIVSRVTRVLRTGPAVPSAQRVSMVLLRIHRDARTARQANRSRSQVRARAQRARRVDLRSHLARRHARHASRATHNRCRDRITVMRCALRAKRRTV